MIGWLTKSVVRGLTEGVDDIAKTLLGSQQDRDRQAADHQANVMDAYAAEFNQRSNRTWWDSFVDGINRLVRPVFTFGLLALFLYCVIDPAGFSLSMQALALMPEWGWGVAMLVLGFWFGGRFVEGMIGKAKAPNPEAVKQIMELQRDMKADQEPPVFESQSTADDTDDIKARLGR